MKLSEIIDSGLDMSQEARMKRAKDMGFTIPAFHGTDQDFNEFDMAKNTSISASAGHGFFFADRSKEASGYSSKTPAGKKKEGGNVIPVLLKVTKPFICNLNSDDKRLRDNARQLVDMAREHSTRLPNADKIDWWGEEGTNIKKQGWNVVYAFLKSKGYDAIYFPDTPSDYDSKSYTRIVMFDSNHIRSVFAAFDPSKANSSNLNA